MTNFPTKLLEGYKKFQSGEYEETKERYESLATSQEPMVMVISCCDSRLNPNAIFDLGPGELYGIRNVANLVPPFEKKSAAICSALEHGINILKIPNIVILGHVNCGGIDAALNYEEICANTDHIGAWVKDVSHLRDNIITSDTQDPLATLEKASIVNSIENLRSYPWVKQAEDEGRLNLFGAYFGIELGQLSIYDEKSGAFKDAAS